MKACIFLIAAVAPIAIHGIRNPFYYGSEGKGELIARAFLHKKKMGLRMYASREEIRTESYSTKSPST